MKPICSFYRKGQSRYGISGKGCPRAHPPLCRKLMNNGTKSPRGCAKGKDCDRLHPKMCPSSINYGECLNDSCSLYHVKGTRRLNSRPHPQEQSNHNKPNDGRGRNDRDLPTQSAPDTQDSFFRDTPGMETRAAGSHGPENPGGPRETSTYHSSTVSPDCTPRTRSPDPLGDSSSTSGVSTPPLLSMFRLVPQTVPSKVPYIKDELDDTSGIAFAVTETWLNDTHLDAELQIDGYSLFRQDRIRKKSKSARSSGEVVIYIRDDHAISAETVFSFTNGVIESLGIYLSSLNLILLVTYRSPDNRSQHRSTSQEFKVYLNELEKCMTSLTNPMPDILFMRDFNLPHANWLTGECSPGADKEEQKMVKCLYEHSLDHFLIQYLDCPIH